MGKIFCWGIFQGEHCSWVGKLEGSNFSGEILLWGDLPEILYQTLLMSCFLFASSILRAGMLRVIAHGKFLPRLNCL